MLCSENGVQDENDQKGKIFLLAGNDDMMTMGMRRMGKEKIQRWPFFWLDDKEYSVMLWSSKERKSKRKYRRLCNQFFWGTQSKLTITNLNWLIIIYHQKNWVEGKKQKERSGSRSFGEITPTSAASRTTVGSCNDDVEHDDQHHHVWTQFSFPFFLLRSQ